MKFIRVVIMTGLSTMGFILSVSASDPRLNSWLTNSSAKYARIYTSVANQSAGNSLTTWSNGTQNQSLPAYSGVQEIYSSSNWIYIRSTGLGIHTMGPWSVGFPNLPVNTKTFYRIPYNPPVPATNTTKTLTGLGAIGYFVDGVAMFDRVTRFIGMVQPSLRAADFGIVTRT